MLKILNIKIQKNKKKNKTKNETNKNRNETKNFSNPFTYYGQIAKIARSFAMSEHKVDELVRTITSHFPEKAHVIIIKAFWKGEMKNSFHCNISL